MQIILASGSQRRIALMKQFNIQCKVVPSSFREDNSLKMPPVKLVLYNARKKAESVKAAHSLVIGADTIVVVGGKVLGKPGTAKRSVEMLRAISGKTVRVISGIAVHDADTGNVKTAFDVARVNMRKISDRQIKAYVATQEPLDKAGAFAIQGKGAALVESVKGDLNTVVGLPMRKLKALLRKAQ